MRKLIDSIILGNDPSGYLDELVLPPGGIIWVRTGFGFSLPPGWAGRVSGRSGLALKAGVTVFHVGALDVGYTDEVAVGLRNDGDQSAVLSHGARIAQLVIHAIPETLEVVEVEKAGGGRGGFGSTGEGTK